MGDKVNYIHAMQDLMLQDFKVCLTILRHYVVKA